MESQNQSLISLDKNGSNVQLGKKEEIQNNSECHSISELMTLESKSLALMNFEIVVEGESHGFVQLRKKPYNKAEEERVMLQFIDISNQIMYEQVHAENEFLAITNATVSHELRNPLQSISS